MFSRRPPFTPAAALMGMSAFALCCGIADAPGEPARRPDAGQASAAAEAPAPRDAGAPPAPVPATEIRDLQTAPLTSRPRYPRGKAVRKLDWIAQKRLRTKGAPVDNPCVQREGERCLKTALTGVFAAFDRLATGEAQDHVTVLTFGNSLIASDRVTDIVRQRLQTVFGDGGYGIVYVEPLHFFGRRAWTGKASKGWYREYLTQQYGGRKKPRYPLGITGGHHVTFKKGARTTWRIGAAEEANIMWLDHKRSAGFRLYVDGKLIERIKPQRDGHAKTTHIEGLAGKKKLRLVADGARLVVYGATLERPQPGVVWDTVGIVAASANTFLLLDETVLAHQLEGRDPTLLVHMLGGNEHRRIDRKVFTYPQVKRDFDTYLTRMKAAAPDADCLVVGPVDAVYPYRSKGRDFRQRVWLNKVNRMQHDTALRHHCAYLDLYRAMGGKGSLKRMNKYGYLSKDRIHPKSYGLDVLGELFARALFDAYQNEGDVLKATGGGASDAKIKREP